MRTYETMITLPTDLFIIDRHHMDESAERYRDYAIYQAREEAPDYCLPSNWHAEHVSGGLLTTPEITYRVTRFSRE